MTILLRNKNNRAREYNYTTGRQSLFGKHRQLHVLPAVTGKAHLFVAGKHNRMIV